MSDSSTAESFTCPYADAGERRCPESICDCFIDTHPDDPLGLHPEDFSVTAPGRDDAGTDDGLKAIES